MDLDIEFASCLCYTPTFKINGVSAKYDDFGEKYDRDPDNAEEYGCGDMRFTGKPATEEVLNKYKINIFDYEFICTQLEEGLSFGQCGYCV